MSPMMIPCANTFCRNYVSKFGDLCPACQKQQKRNDKPTFISKHEGERMSREDRLKINNEHRKADE